MIRRPHADHRGESHQVPTRIPICDTHWGLLGTGWTRPGLATTADLQLFRLFAEVAGSVIARWRGNEALEHQAKHDPLTRVWSRRESYETIDRPLKTGSAPTIFLIGLEGFKPINDEIGHWAGDVVLSTIADRIERIVPVGHTVGRLGGDECV